MSDNKERLDAAGKILKILAGFSEDEQARIVAMIVEATKPADE